MNPLSDSPEPVVEKACAYFADGYHCSEAVSRAVLETLDGEADPTCIRIANPFLGGMARTKKNTCGALSGALIVLGYRFGRLLADEDDSLCVALSREMYDAFEHEIGFHSVNCQTLYDHRENNSCNAYVAAAARLVLGIVQRQEITAPGS